MLTPSRRGSEISVLDCIAQSLKPTKANPSPAKSFKQLAEHAAKLRGTPVDQSFVRSVVYRHSELFERATNENGVTWRLSKKGKEAIAAV